MKIPFYRKFVIHSYDSVEDITRKLEEETTGMVKFILGDNKKIFTGKVYKDGFRIGLSGYHPEGNCGRSSFDPITIGEYRETEKGTDITITQRLSIDVAVFSFSVIAFFLYITVVLSMAGEIIALFPMMLLVVSVILLVAGFRSGAERTKKIIEKVLW